MTREQADRIERKLNALCKAAGGPLSKLDLAQPPANSAQRTLAAVRHYADTLAASSVPSSQSHAATLLAILDGDDHA